MNTAQMVATTEQTILNMGEQQRLVLALCYLEELGLEEIARVLEISEERVKELHAEAVREIKARLKIDIKQARGGAHAEI
jgi:RNA polymerase sigma factor for flagellar operon FliA